MLFLLASAALGYAAYEEWQSRGIQFLPGDQATDLLQEGEAVIQPASASKVQLLAQAISVAEGFDPSGASTDIPTAYNNPGDITDGTGAKIQFASVTDGWNRLYAIVRGWLSGVSSLYPLSTTLAQVGHIYVDGPNAPVSQQSQDWATNVVNWLNEYGQMSPGNSLGVDNTLQDWVNA